MSIAVCGANEIDVNVQSKLSLSTAWKDRLGITQRRAPELYESSQDLGAALHAAAIRVALDELGLSAVFCVQNVPAVGIVVTEAFNRASIMELHARLWNQGLISLLLVIADDTLRAYSLMRTPQRDAEDRFDADCQIGGVLAATADVLEFQNLIYGAESGRLWWEHQDKFRPKERVDQVLLDNLIESHRLLCDTERFGDNALGSDAAQALLIQTMFIAYLEDRKILTERYFRNVSSDQATDFVAVLGSGQPTQMRTLFGKLREDFSGNIFFAPCSFDPADSNVDVHPEHMRLLAEFRPGEIDMKCGQYRFWGYDFRYIPVELISAVYDRFLGEREAERRDKGAYYTPMFLADTVIAQVWDMLDDEIKGSGEFLDPACGSAIFLVRMFQRLCEHARAKRGRQTVAWPDLLKILGRLHGWDINGGAVRVAVFSLYVALLEEVSPRDIQKLIEKGRLLPELWGKNLVVQDFFSTKDDSRFAVLIGNPPWSSRRGNDRSSAVWAKAADVPVPGNEDSWAFAWKALRHLRPSGLVAFLLPAMGFLHNQADITVKARNRFFLATAMRRIINFADLRFQLFEKAVYPTALLLFGNREPGQLYTRFDYWAPKADLNLRIKRFLTLSSADKMRLSVEQLLDNPLLFKQRLWMREPDAKLFGYLGRFRKLGELIRSSKNDRSGTGQDWVVGLGYKTEPTPEKLALQNQRRRVAENPKPREAPKKSDHVGKLPDLPITQLVRLFQSSQNLKPAESNLTHRLGFEAGYFGNRVLVARGVDTIKMRLKASYCTDPLTLQQIIQAIKVPASCEFEGKLLAAILNSRLAIWFAFHGTASFGADRPHVGQSDLPNLPFPKPNETGDAGKSANAANALVAIIDEAQGRLPEGFHFGRDPEEILRQIDELTYAYFGLSDEERALVEDTMNVIVPSIQPRETNFPPLWDTPDRDQRGRYAQSLIGSLQPWIKTGERINAKLVARASDLAVLELGFDSISEFYEEAGSGSVADTLARLSDQLHIPLSGNFQLMPDLRIFADDRLYLVKPMQMRFWLRSAAMADADAIAHDLQDAIHMRKRADA